MQRGTSLSRDNDSKVAAIPGYEFEDEEFIADLRDRHSAPEMRDFLLVMSLCHTVLPESDEEAKRGIKYKASSPDENALVTAARELGHAFFSRVDTRCKVDIDGIPREFEVLNINEFTSTRKRMSVVVRAEGELMLLVKGADDVIIQNLRHKNTPQEDVMMQHLKHFGNLGLRTLVMAKKVLDEDEYEDWNRKFLKASNDVHDRDQKLHDLAVEMETNLSLVGASAIEDKLQLGVPEAIANLAQAGIKIWMLTGDKLETAINIGYSCHLLKTKMTLLRVDQNTSEKVNQALRAYLSQNKAVVNDEADDIELAMIISGSSLKFIFEDPDDTNEMRRVFLQLCIMCRAVVACRLNPKQKAEIVRLVKNAMENQPLTLAIGDGANDVSMIQEAHIGVGISGNEGMQAVRSSDYALAQFRYLTRLLLVHGRWNYRRICLVILYSFYKNITLVFTLFYYGFETGFTGTTLYESYLGAAWNIAFTLFPIIFYGVLEQDISDVTAQQNPRSYKRGQHRLDFNVKKMVLWVGTAILHSIIIYFLSAKILSNPPPGGIISKDGIVTDSLFLAGTITNFVCVMTVNLKLALHTLYWTKLTSVFMFLTIVFWFFFVGIYSLMIDISFDFFGSAISMELAVFWMSIILVPITAILIDICILYIYRFYFPTEEHILRELEHNAMKKDPLNPQMDFRRPSVVARQMPRSKRKGGGKQYQDQPALQKQIEHLKSVIRQKKTKPLSKDVGSVGEAYSSKNIHWATLEFTGESRKFEKGFRDVYIAKNIRGVRISAVIMYFFLLIYTIYSFVDGEENWPERAVGTFIVIPLMLMFIFSSQFRKYYFGFQFWAMLLVGVIQVYLIEERGVNGLALFAIVVFLLLRNRFPLSCTVVAVNFVFYVVIRVGIGEMDALVALQILFLHLCIVAFAASGAYGFERAFRKDYLLQKHTQAEQERTNIILHNIFPKYISKQLYEKHNKKIRSRSSSDYDPAKHQLQKPLVAERSSVSIVFVDIVGFSEILDTHSPQRLVGFLDALYSTLDEVCPRFGMQKMETVGKTYMACAGLEGSARNHAHAAVLMAKEVISILSHCQDINGNPVKVRCGIHTGTVIAGVVGDIRPQFSLFGDTINVASRMQSTGKEMQIHISQYTYELIRGEFDFDKKHTFVKGKCDPEDESTYMKTYIVGPGKRAAPRRLSIIHPTQNNEVIAEEIKELIMTKRERAKIDPFDKMKESTRTHRFSLQFRDDELETSYMTSRSKKLGKAVITPAVIVCLFFAVEAIFEYIRSRDGSHASVIAFIYCVRYSFCLLCILFIYMARQPMFSERGTIYTVVLFTIAVASSCVASIVIVPPEQTDKGQRLTLIIILLMTLVSNAGALNITMIVVVDILSVFIWMIADFGFAVNGLGVAYHGLEDSAYNLFWIVVALCVNVTAGYAREMYLRREFVLVKTVKDEKEFSDDFLYMMVPTSVATNLKEGKSGIADQFENVTILYSDIRGFTTLAAKTKPEEIVQLLNELFGQFDKATDEYTVYKVQTIGDAYVCISGFPFQQKKLKRVHPDDPVEMQNCVRCVQFARAMQKIIQDIRHLDDKIQMRIGIHTGTIVAGCIGTKALRYDIWGTDCLVGNKFESEGIPGQICVSEASQSLLRGKYNMEPQKETFEVRGKVYKKWIIDPDKLHPVDEDEDYLSPYRYAKKLRGDIVRLSRNQKGWKDALKKNTHKGRQRTLPKAFAEEKDYS